ncbi:MAG: glutamate 5-kinase [Dehalococcoidia bacterium]|nr:glutamate 5-kinase [Dehalococcoidia bacterium]
MGNKSKKGEYRRIVAKFGTNLLTAGTEHLDLEVMATLVGQVVRLHQQGLEVIIVSSGAVAAGRQQLRLAKDRKDIPSRQVMAAVGQNALMHSYEQLFDWHGITVAQALLTKANLSDRLGYLNARNTLLALLELGVVPIINENDVVAVDELEGAAFGDNDNLSGMVSNLVDADLLVVLCDVAGLCTTDPATDRSAQLITRVDCIDERIEHLAGGTRGRGVGGMATKVQAARLATASGATVIIADGKEQDLLSRLVKGESIGTLFPPTASKMESRKRWMLTGLAIKGSLVIDDGAVVALKEQNKSLLPAGIKTVNGDFLRGDAVDIIIEKGKKGEKIARGISNYSSRELAMIKGARSDRIESLLGYGYGDEVVHRNNLVVL